jgi:Protein of unknown function (DUF1064)
MTTKLTASEYKALRRRPDRATLAQDGDNGNPATCGGGKDNHASEANVGRSGGYSKYKAIPVEIDGIRFASKAEGRRYVELKRLQAAGLIRGLALQTSFPFMIGDDLMFTYVSDFFYEDVQTGKRIIEDVKGVLTPVYKLKKKIIEKYYGMKITEIHHAKKGAKSIRGVIHKKGRGVSPGR